VRCQEQNRTGGIGRRAVELTEILRCPKTGSGLQYDGSASILRAERSDAAYPVIDGIVDFCPQRHDRVSASYDKVASRYDPCITASSVSMKVLARIIWGRAGDCDPMEEVLSLLPDRFEGVLLDVPVGTGVFTAALYSRYPEATIIGVDCSINMLRKAKTCFREQGVKNIHLLRADAANLPIRDSAVDLVLSMNGWHAFADKRGTTAQMKRVLRPGGRLVACGYVRGAGRRSDWFVKYFGVRNGFFTPPFFAAGELAEWFDGFRILRQDSDRSLAYFEAINEGEHSDAAP
jgi:SAM-dependent methyltransferase